MARSLPRRQETGGLKDKKEESRKEYQRLLHKFEVGGFMAQKNIVESRERKYAAGQRSVA